MRKCGMSNGGVLISLRWWLALNLMVWSHCCKILQWDWGGNWADFERLRVWHTNTERSKEACKVTQTSERQIESLSFIQSNNDEAKSVYFLQVRVKVYFFLFQVRCADIDVYNQSQYDIYCINKYYIRTKGCGRPNVNPLIMQHRMKCKSLLLKFISHDTLFPL